jgi:hypothetical protein
MISGVKVLNMVNTNSMRFTKIFNNRRNVTIGMVSKGYIDFAMEVSKHFEYNCNKICCNFQVSKRRLL